MNLSKELFMATEKQVFENTLTRIGYKMRYKEQLDTFDGIIFVLTAFSYFNAFCKWLQQWKK